jgi:hypothetical protein
MNIPACPPKPTLQELQTDQFRLVDMNELVPNEIVILRYRDDITCIEIINNTNDPNGYIEYRVRFNEHNVGNGVTSLKRYIPAEVEFYRKIDHKAFYDDTAKTMRVRMRGYPENQQLAPEETTLANDGLSDKIKEFLGGRRKQRKTKRTRKNKRKSTRRVRRKYKK